MSELIIYDERWYMHMITGWKWHWTLSTRIKLREKRQSCKKTNKRQRQWRLRWRRKKNRLKSHWSALFLLFLLHAFLQRCGCANASFSLWPITSTVEQHLVCYTLLLLLLPLVLLCKIMRIRIDSPWSTIASTLLMHLTNIIMEIMHKCDLITFKRR